MRHIEKLESPDVFEDWKRRFENKHGKKVNFNDLNKEKDLKNTVKNRLISEQFGLCCYCCKGIQYDNSHIEHFRPQGTFTDKTVDYENIHVSCEGNKNKSNFHCGHKKDKVE